MRSDELLSPPCLLAFFLFCFVAFVAGCHSFFVLLLVCLLSCCLECVLLFRPGGSGVRCGSFSIFRSKGVDPSLKALLGSFSGLADQRFGAGALASLGASARPFVCSAVFFFYGKHTPSVRAFLKSRVI